MTYTPPKEQVLDRVRRTHREAAEKLSEAMLEMFTTNGYGLVGVEVTFENGVPQNYRLTGARRFKMEAA